MIKACFKWQMNKIDFDAEQIAGIPSIVLMENAAIAGVNSLTKTFPNINHKSIGIFCGKGNNAGDGFAIARHLLNLNINVIVYLVCGYDFKGDCLINYNIINKMKCNIVYIENEELLPFYIKSHDVIIDCIFGTGIHGEIIGIARHCIENINKYSKYTLSVDVPSGINADTGEICGVCIYASKTITFAAYKIGMLLFPAADYIGDVELCNISIPQYIIDIQDINTNILDIKSSRSLLPNRFKNSQKGNYGKVLILGGSVGMTGAPCLSAMAAVKMGSGLVTVGVPKSLNIIIEQKITEPMSVELSDKDGILTYDCIDKILELLKRSDAVLFGPGIGRSSDIKDILFKILQSSKVPVVIDADGLNALSEDISILEKCQCDVILTPHSVEMSRLNKKILKEIESDRIGISAEFAQKNDVTLVLKGHHTVVTGADGIQYINNTGNSGMATGGSGDVLAGIIVSLIASGTEKTQAAALAAYIHGIAGDIAKEKLGERSLSANDIVNSIPYALKMIEEIQI